MASATTETVRHCARRRRPFGFTRTRSIGFRHGEQVGKKRCSQPAASMSRRSALRWTPKLSRTTVWRKRCAGTGSRSRSASTATRSSAPGSTSDGPSPSGVSTASSVTASPCPRGTQSGARSSLGARARSGVSLVGVRVASRNTTRARSASAQSARHAARAASSRSSAIRLVLERQPEPPECVRHRRETSLRGRARRRWPPPTGRSARRGWLWGLARTCARRAATLAAGTRRGGPERGCGSAVPSRCRTQRRTQDGSTRTIAATSPTDRLASRAAKARSWT